MHYLRLVDFLSIDYRNLYGYCLHLNWGTTKGKIVTQRWAGAALVLGWVSFFSMTPAYGLVWNVQDSYKANNNGAGIDSFLMGNSQNNLIYSGFQTHASGSNAQTGVGGGYRRLIGTNHTVGTYVFWDGLFDYVDQAVAFSNINLGLEGNLYFLTFRVNGYLPFSRIERERYNWGSENRGNEIIKKGDCYISEMIQYGWDGQVGITAFQDRATLFGGTYWFYGDMAKPIQGIVGGITMDITPRIRVHGQYTCDSLNKPFFTVGAQFNRAASPSLQTGPLYRLWRPTERSILPVGTYTKGDWCVKEADLYFVNASKARRNNAKQEGYVGLASFEHPAPNIDQALLDKIAKQSPQNAKIFVDYSIYEIKGGLQLRAGQSLNGINKNKLSIPKLNLEEPCCFSDNTSIQNMSISLNRNSESSSLIKMHDVQNVSLIQCNIESTVGRFTDSTFTGIDIHNASCVLGANRVRFENIACFSKATLNGIKASGDGYINMPTKNSIDLATNSKHDTLKPMDIAESIQYSDNKNKNSIILKMPINDDYLDELDPNQINVSGEEEYKILNLREATILKKAELPKEECGIVESQERDNILDEYLDKYRLKHIVMSQTMKEGITQECTTMHDRIERNIYSFQEQIDKTEQEIETASKELCKAFVAYDLLPKEIRLKEFMKKSPQEIKQLYDQYADYKIVEIEQDKQQPKSKKEKRYSLGLSTQTPNWEALNSHFKRKKILDDLQNKQQKLQLIQEQLKSILNVKTE